MREVFSNRAWKGSAGAGGTWSWEATRELSEPGYSKCPAIAERTWFFESERYSSYSNAAARRLRCSSGSMIVDNKRAGVCEVGAAMQ